jgi:hypothetical protein
MDVRFNFAIGDVIARAIDADFVLINENATTRTA